MANKSHFTKVEKTHYGDRVTVSNAVYERVGEISFDITRDPGHGVSEREFIAANLPIKEAREIAQWILDNTEEPREVHPDWDSIEIGQYFGYFYDKESGLKQYANNPDREGPYLKTGENSLTYLPLGGAAEYRDQAPGPSCHRLVGRPVPKPLSWEDLEVGDKFTFGSVRRETRIKVNPYSYVILGGHLATIFPKENLIGANLVRVED